jgi:hypothetical protein
MRAALARLAALGLLVAAPGCATEQLRFAALSSDPFPALGYQGDAPTVPNVSATVRSHIILWIPTNTRTPTLQDAVDSALARGGGDLLVDAEVEHWWVFVPFLYGQEGWTVRGDVVRSKRVEAPPIEKP